MSTLAMGHSNRRWCLAVFLCATGLAAGCGGGDSTTGPTDGPPTTEPPAVAAVAIAPAAPSITEGDTIRLTATPKDAEGAALADRTVTWSSSDEAVATVDGQGLVTAHAAGTVIITATAEGEQGQATITVAAIPVASVVLTPDTSLMVVGDTLRLEATVLGAEGDTLTGRTITWTSNDTTIATVDETGLVTALRHWPATITATTEGHATSAQVDIVLRFKQIEPNISTTCALTVPGAAYCWGANDNGELGDGTIFSTLSPVAVLGGLKFSQLAVGGSRCALTEAGKAYCWGSTIGPTAVPGDLTFTQLVGGDGHTCGLTSAGAAYCWDGSGTPAAVSGGLTFTQLSAGDSRTCGLTTSGAAYCWGSNPFGEIGDGTTTGRSAPAAVVGGLSFSRISTDGSHTCGLTTTGSAYCWGWNGQGGLGTGNTTSTSTPTAVATSLTFVEIKVSPAGHTCALTAAGAAYCWGYNIVGQLSDGTTTSRLVPTPVLDVLGTTELTFTQIRTGFRNTCGLSSKGIAYCWGDNDVGQLGIGYPDSDRHYPAAVDWQF